jgi:tetratricopeptide (TPR) repeat protein
MPTILRTLILVGFAVAVVAALPSTGSLAAGSSSGSSSSSSSSSASSGGNDYNNAVTMIDDKDYGGAIPLLKKVVAMEPTNADALNYLGYAHRMLGKQTEALSYYEQALALQPQHVGANEYLGELYLEMKQLPKAEERLAVLEQACGDCKEYVELKEKIDDYKAKQQS